MDVVLLVVADLLLLLVQRVEVVVEARGHCGAELGCLVLACRKRSLRSTASVMVHLHHASVLHAVHGLRLVRWRRVGSVLAGRVGSTRLPGVVVPPGRCQLVVLGDLVEVDLRE